MHDTMQCASLRQEGVCFRLLESTMKTFDGASPGRIASKREQIPCQDTDWSTVDIIPKFDERRALIWL